MIDAVEILRKIYGYLRGDLSLEAFRDWIVEAQFQVENARESRAHQILWQLEIFYAHFSDNLVDETVWKRSLEYLAAQEQSGTKSVVVSEISVQTTQTGTIFMPVEAANLVPELVSA
jgi:hypothetical protein